MSIGAAAEAVSSALHDKHKSVPQIRQAVLEGLRELSVSIQMADQSDVSSSVAVVDGTLRTLLATHLPLFGQLVTTTICSIYCNLFIYGDARGARSAIDFLVKQATSVPSKNNGSAGGQSNRIACLHAAAALFVHSALSSSSDLADVTSALLKLCTSTDKANSSSLRAAAAAALQSVLESQGARFFPAPSVQGPGDTKASPLSKLYSSVLSTCYSMLSDESPCVRACVGPLLQAMATGSGGYRAIACMDLLTCASEGISDPHPLPRQACANAMATILSTSILATRLGAVAQEAATAAQRLAVLRGGGESSEDDSDAGDDQRSTASKDFGDDRDFTAEVDGGEGGSSATKGSSANTAAASLGKELLGSMRKFGQSVKKAAQAAGKQMQVKDRAEGGDAGKPVTVDAASRAASAVLEGAGGSRRGGVLRTALRKVNLGKGKREAVDVAFTPAAAVAYMCSLIRSSGSMAHRTGCCAAAIRTSCAQAAASMLRSVQGAAGGTHDEEYMQVLQAALATLQPTADATETPADPYLPSLLSSAVVLGGVPLAGPHAAHIRACVTHICVHGMMKPPVVKTSYIQPLWRAWQLAMFDKMMVLLVSAARSESSSVRASVTTAGGPPTTAASAALATPAAGLRKFASKLSMASSPFTSKPKSGPSTSSAAAASDHTSQPPLTDAAVHVVLTVMEEVLHPGAHPYSPQVLDRAAALCDIAVNLGLRAESHALRMQCARTVRRCLALNSAPLGELLAELLATVQACVDEIAAPAWLMKSSAAAAASALADASLWACKRRGVPFVCPAGSAPVMTHAGAAVLAEAEGGVGCPGAGPGSGCGVATGDIAAVLRRCTSSSSLLSVAVACLADMMRAGGGGGEELPVRPALLDTACEVAGLLMTTCQQITPESALGGASRAHIPGPGSSPQSILTHSAVSALVHETRAALAQGSAAVMSALSRMPVAWLVASNHWSTLYSACARGVLLGCAPLAESGLGTSREGTGVWVLTPVGISAQTAAVSAMLSSSSTAHSTVIGSPSPKVMPGEGGGTVAADAAGMGTARSLYSGIASAWQMHLLASSTTAVRSILEGLTACAQLPERTASSLGSLVTLGLRLLTACQVVPAPLQDMLRLHPDRARARLLADAANSLLVLPDTASCVSFGADRDGLSPSSIEASPPVVVRGLPYTCDDGQYYSPAGVSLPAVSVARQCVIKAATNLVAAVSCLPLAHSGCSSFRGPALSATLSLLSCGTVSLVPLEVGLIDVPEQKAGQRISSGVVIPEPNCTYAHLESAVSSSLRSLSSHPSDDTWSPLVVALAHGGGLNVPREQGRLVYEGRPLSLLCADIDDGAQPSASAFLQQELGSLCEQHPLQADLASVLAMCLPALTVQQSALVAQALGAVLGSGPDLQDEQSEGMTVGYRQAGMSVLSGQTRVGVQEHAATVIARMLQQLETDQVLSVAQEASVRPSSESSSSGLASATPAAWLTTLRLGLGHALSSRAPRLQAAAAAALAQCARLSGPLHGRRLLLSLVKQMAALGGETLAAVAAISAGTEGGEDVTHAARYTQAGVALAIAAIAREAQTRTAEYDTLSREGRPCTFLPLTMITSAFQVAPVLAVVKEGQLDALPVLLTAWATVMRMKADEIEHAVRSGSDVSTEMQQSVVQCVTSTMALVEHCSLALPSPWEADIELPRVGDDPYGTATAARSVHARVIDNVRLTVGSDGALVARPAGGDDRVTAAAATLTCSAEGFYSVAALDDPAKGAVAAVSVGTIITHPATGNRTEPVLLPIVLPGTGEVLPGGVLLQAARASLTGRKKRKATASKLSSIDSLISAAISLHACTGSVPGRAMAAATCAALQADATGWSRNGRSTDTRETVCVRGCMTALSTALADAVRALSFLPAASAAGLLPRVVSCLSTLSALATTAQQGSALLQAITGVAKQHSQGRDAVSAISLAAVRYACSGSGPVGLISSTASPLPQVLGGCLSAPPLPPLPSSIDTDRHSRRIVHLLLGSVQNAGVPLYMEDRPANPSPVLAAWQACQAESILSLVPCGLTTGVEESTLAMSPQFLALQIVESRRCGRQRVHLLNPSATVPTRAWGCLLALACSPRDTVPVGDALNAWAKVGASSTWPSYFVSIGLLGDVLLSVPREAWPYTGPGAQAAVHSLLRSLASRPLVLQDRVLSLCDIISGQQTVSAANAAHFAAHAAQQGAGKSVGKLVKGDDEGGDFGATAAEEDADEDAAGADDSAQQAASGASSDLPFSLSQLDSDASRCSLLTPSLDALYTLFDTGVWRAAGDEAKVRACALLQGVLDGSPSLPGLLSVPVGTALLLATCQLCAYESAALAPTMETEEEPARDRQGQHSSAPSAVHCLSTLCREAVLLLAAIVRAFRRLADPDVPGTHGLAQHAATLLPVLLPLLRDDVPLGILSVAVDAAVDCILCGMLSDSGSVRRVLQALLPSPKQQLLPGELPMSKATMVKAVAASNIVSFALYIAPEQCSFESSFPSSLRPYQSTLRAWPTPPWAPRIGDISIVRLSSAASAAIVACMQDYAIKGLYKTMLLTPAEQDRSCIRYCLASVLAVASCTAGTSGGANVIPALPGAQQVAGLLTQAMKDTIINDALVTGDAACAALCSVSYIASDGAAGLPAALAHAAAKHPLLEAVGTSMAAFAQGQSKVSVQQGIADVYAAVGKPRMTLSSWLSCFTAASASSQASLQALAEAVLQAREYDKASPAILPLFTGALGYAGRPSSSRSAVSAIRHVAQLDQGQAQAQLVSVLQHTLALALTDPTPVMLTPAAWEHVILPLVPIAPALVEVYVSHLCQLLTAPLQKGNSARLGMLSGLLNSICTLGPVAAVTTAWMPVVSYSISVFLESVYQDKALHGQVQDVQLVARANEAGQAAAAVLCAISTHLARSNGAVATACLFTLIPLLQPGEQATGGGVDSGWVSAACQQAVGASAVGMAKEVGAEFKRALASLTAEAQAQIQGALRAGVTGSRLESKFSLEHAAVGQDRREGNVPARLPALAASTGGSKPASMFNLSKFKASAAPTGALKPAAPSQAVDVSAFLQGDDDFSRALRAKGRGAVVDEDETQEEEEAGDQGQVPGMEQPSGHDNDE